jgi:type VII secretion-associated protein (TIGR03931 family)
LVVVSPASGRATVVARVDEDTAIAEVMFAIGMTAQVIVDAPADSMLFADVLADLLRGNGTAVSFAREGAVLSAVVEGKPSGSAHARAGPAQSPRRRRGTAVLSGIASAVVLCAGAALRGGAPDTEPTTPVSLLVEGRMGVMVPATWTVQRITAGPGSARLQILSSTDPDIALHLTQTAGVSTSQASTVEAIRIALLAEPDGVFVDFNPSDSRAGRPAVTYREIRQGRNVAWAVVLDQSVRIAIGCQSAPEREAVVRDVCDRAIQTAHAIF